MSKDLRNDWKIIALTWSGVLLLTVGYALAISMLG